MKFCMLSDNGMKTVNDIVLHKVDVASVKLTTGQSIPVTKREAIALYNFYQAADSDDRQKLDELPIIPLLAIFYSVLLNTEFDGLQKTNHDLKKTTFH
jgi:hypothetical protein